jgi:hypothetical protein
VQHRSRTDSSLLGHAMASMAPMLTLRFFLFWVDGSRCVRALGAFSAACARGTGIGFAYRSAGVCPPTRNPSPSQETTYRPTNFHFHTSQPPTLHSLTTGCARCALRRAASAPRAATSAAAVSGPRAFRISRHSDASAISQATSRSSSARSVPRMMAMARWTCGSRRHSTHHKAYASIVGSNPKLGGKGLHVLQTGCEFVQLAHSLIPWLVNKERIA